MIRPSMQLPTDSSKPKVPAPMDSLSTRQVPVSFHHAMFLEHMIINSSMLAVWIDTTKRIGFKLNSKL